MCTFLVAGTVGAILADRFGDRSVVMGGAIVSSVSLAASAYVTNVYLLMVTFGILTGRKFFYPFDDFVDQVRVDQVNSEGCRTL